MAAPARKPLALFALHVVFATVLFSILPLKTPYEIAFAGVGNMLAGVVPGERSVEFDWVEPKRRSDRVQLEMRGFTPEARGHVWEAGFSIGDLGRVPTAMIIALVLATPMAAGRKFAAGLAALALFHGFLYLQLAIIAWGAFATAIPDSVPLGDAMIRATPIAENIFREPIPRLLAVFVAWALTANPGSRIDTADLRGQLGRLLRDESDSS